MSRKIVRQNSTEHFFLIIFLYNFFIFTYNKIVRLIIVEAKIKLKYILAYIWSILCVGKLYRCGYNICNIFELKIIIIFVMVFSSPMWMN